MGSNREINTAKIGTRHETIYYYKQKVVNWEFRAASSYETFVLVEKQTPQIVASSTAVCVPSPMIDVNVTRYITEESFKDLITFYRVSVTNTIVGKPPVQLDAYTNTDTEAVIDASTVIDNVIDSSDTTFSAELTVKCDNNYHMYNSRDVLNVAYSHKFPNSSYVTSGTVAADGMFCEQDIYTDPTVTSHRSQASSIAFMVLHKDIMTMRMVIDELESAYMTKSWAGLSSAIGIILPVATYVASSIETVCECEYEKNKQHRAVASNVAVHESHTTIVV